MSTHRAMERGELEADLGSARLANNLNDSRKGISKLKPEQSDMFDQICEQSVPEELRDTKVIEAGMVSWKTWLGEMASDADLLDYMEWHVGSIEDQERNPAIRAAIHEQREAYKEAVHQALPEGWLHPSAALADKRVDSVQTHIGDVFTMTLEEAIGLYLRREHTILFAGATAIHEPGNYEAVVNLVNQIAFHELDHAALGWLDVRWWNEALTEHTAQVLLHGDLETVNPNDREHSGTSHYEEDRRLLSRILEDGRKPIPIELATRAYSSGLMMSPETKALRTAVDRSWGHMVSDDESAFHQLNQYVSELEYQYGVSSGLSKPKAIKKAMKDINSDMALDPELVFNGNAHERPLTLLAA